MLILFCKYLDTMFSSPLMIKTQVVSHLQFLHSMLVGIKLNALSLPNGESDPLVTRDAKRVKSRWQIA